MEKFVLGFPFFKKNYFPILHDVCACTYVCAHVCAHAVAHM